MSDKVLKAVYIVALVIITLTASATAKEVITIDLSKIFKSQKQPLIGENLNFLMSSDTKWPRKVSMKSRIKEMNLGMLRFPYGHLADNYLFTDAPFNDGIKGLTPRVVSMRTAPGTHQWAVNDKGYFKKALDFDEFMEYVNELNVEPLIMVNMLGYDEKHYPNTVVSFEDLKKHAVEWVKYANITRGHNIKYWQLGNEVASHTDKETYFKNFTEVAKAMKAVDPSIHIGFGEDGRTNWIPEAFANEEIGQYIDFISPHQYLFGRTWTESYQAWRKFSGKLTSKIDKLQNYVNNSKHHKEIPLIITEYGITGGNYAENDPQGYAYLKPVSQNSFVTLSSDKNSVIKGWGKVKAENALHIKLVKDGSVLLRPYQCSGCFISAAESPDQALTLSDIFNENGQWRIITAAKNQYYIESIKFPSRYLKFDVQSKVFTLKASSKDKADKFNIKPLASNKKKQAELVRSSPPSVDKFKNYGNDLWKSLIFAELSLTTFNHKNVSHMVHWNSHTSWEGEFGGYHGNTANSLNNTSENTLTPIGQVIKFINNHTFDKVISIKEKNGYIRAYATSNSENNDLAIILLNKNYQAESVQLDLMNYLPSTTYNRWLYTGDHPEDEYPQIRQDDNGNNKLVKIENHHVQTHLAPLSLTVIYLTEQ